MAGLSVDPAGASHPAVTGGRAPNHPPAAVAPAPLSPPPDTDRAELEQLESILKRFTIFHISDKKKPEPNPADQVGQVSARLGPS
jgi:hypothetical protein